MTETYEGIVARMEQKFEELAGYPADEASDVGIRIRVLAQEIYSVCAAVEWLKKQTFAQTATGAELEKRALERGVVRKPAVAAAGTLCFSLDEATWFDLKIPAGTVCRSEGSGAMRYLTTEEGTLPAGETEAEVPARAELPGAAGNAESSMVDVLVTPVAYVTAVLNTVPFTGGEDAESDESLRARLLADYAAPGNGSNAQWYRGEALTFDNVHSAGIVPRESGAGTVGVYLGGEGEAAPDEAVQKVRAALQERREIAVDVNVQPAQAVAVDVTASVVPKPGLDPAGVEYDCRIALRNYFKSLGVGDAATVSGMTVALMATGEIADCALSTPGKAVERNQLAAAGGLNVAAGG